jgi:sestrin
MFYGDGPLPLPDRHFIALMGASRHSCQYLIDLHTQEFLRLGGDERWLRDGLDRVPLKIRSLDEMINKVLAHQPWLLNVSDLDRLTRCPSPDNWSLSELVHGVVILSQIHALCSFVFGCGIVSSQPPSPVSPSESAQACNGQDGEVEVLMARMKELNQSSSDCSQEEKARHFVDVNLESSKLFSHTANGASRAALDRFTKDVQFQYIDFVKRGLSSETPTFKILEYSWEDQGYSLVNQLISNQLSNLLDKKFSLTKTLTYYTMGDHTNVDTSKYRLAVWNYIQSLYGIRHDDYDYAEVNQLVSRPMKAFIKTVCCFPSRTTELMRGTVMADFQHSEKVHVILMILEARLQSEFLYFLRIVMRVMTSQ